MQFSKETGPLRAEVAAVLSVFDTKEEQEEGLKKFLKKNYKGEDLEKATAHFLSDLPSYPEWASSDEGSEAFSPES